MSNAGATTTSSETDPYLSEASNVTNGSANARNHAALTVGKKLASAGESGVVVTMLCDGATKYLSESFWDDQD